MKVFILLAIVAAAFADSEEVCGANQHYEECGTSCPLTCENYSDPPQVCILMCNPGCHCDEGFVKAKDGSCVKPEECPQHTEQCGENQHYETCGTACPLTCDNHHDPPKACVKMCSIGCHCNEGYVKTRDGRCIDPMQCPIESSKVEKSCLGKPETGICQAYFRMWYYDIHTEKCHQFVYGGCQGNGNRYRTEEECMEHCEGVRLRESSADICDLPAVTGVCDAYFPRYYFDKKTGKCETFVYGGCGGNKNNFHTLAECQQTCGFRPKAAHSRNELCSLEAETGLCRGYFERFYYDDEAKQCKKFIYGGCGGNENNFKSIEECHNTCA